MKILLGIAVSAYCAAAAPDWQSRLREVSRAYQYLAEEVDPAVVQVITSGYAFSADAPSPVLHTRRSTGSGVVISPDGFIVTNAHVLSDFRRVQVLLPQKSDQRVASRSVLKPNGKLAPARVVGVDRETDIAVLKVEANALPHLRFGDSDLLRQGQLVFACGSPYGLENSVTMGIVSSVARQVRPDDRMVYIQTDASINPGNSGGPLVDAGGAVVGINTFILTKGGGHEGVGFAVPGNIVRNVYEQILKYGRVRRGQIGIVPQTITPELAAALRLERDWGVLFADVIPRGPAEFAGLQIQDMILRVNGKAVEDAHQLGAVIYQSAGEELELEVLRASSVRTVRVAVLERPRDPDRILALAAGEANRITRLGILAVDLDENVTPLLPQLRKLSGVVVAGVVAEMAGPSNSLHSGDVIYSVNGEAVRDLGSFQAAIATLPSGETVAMHLERDGTLRYVLMTVE